jgi:PIN domain nuclease of toxin-antitoxin system
MRLLLDTHVLLWWLKDASQLSREARAAIAGSTAVVYVSAASVWEAAIKAAAGKLRVSGDLPAAIPTSGFVELPVAARHAWRAGALPRHHGDPFDRILVAQATIEELTIVTHDPAFREYGVPVLPA